VVGIIGVVDDLSSKPRKTSEDAVIYLPSRTANTSSMMLAVHVLGGGSILAPRIRAIAAAIDPELRLSDVMTLDKVNEADRIASQFFLRVLALVSAVALLLSTAGVYSLMAFTVARRTREIGIRAAVGADQRRILTGIFSRAFTQVGIGVLLGCVPGAVLLFAGAPEVSRGSSGALTAAALTGVTAFMFSVTLVTCAAPARRALRVHPLEALRAG
jgi:ABC-type antimicrobial peptide transport system permease subunit